jgi:hypothetical protein
MAKIGKRLSHLSRVDQVLKQDLMPRSILGNISINLNEENFTALPKRYNLTQFR